MAKSKSNPALQQAKCALCGEDVKLTEYAAHVAAKHTPTVTVPTPAQIPAQNWQPSTPQAPITAPPPQAPRHPFVNAALLYQNAGRLEARILGVRASVGGNTQFGPAKGGWFLDLDITGKGAHTARVTIGDLRHQRLWAKFQDKWVGQTIIIRLPQAEDKTKAHWVIG